MKNQKKKPDWLHGDSDQKQIESTREKWSIGGRVMSEEEAAELADLNNQNWIERDAPYPEAQLKESLGLVKRLLEVLDPKRADFASKAREELRLKHLAQGLSEEEAQRECDKVSVRNDLTLRCARDTFNWLNAALCRAKRGRKRINEALDEAADINTVRLHAIEAQNDFVEAISYALNGGRALGELKPRVHHDTKPGSKKKPHRKGIRPIENLIIRAETRYSQKPKNRGKRPTSGDILQEIEREPDQSLVRRNAERAFEYRIEKGWKRLPKNDSFRVTVHRYRNQR